MFKKISVVLWVSFVLSAMAAIILSILDEREMSGDFSFWITGGGNSTISGMIVPIGTILLLLAIIFTICFLFREGKAEFKKYTIMFWTLSVLNAVIAIVFNQIDKMQRNATILSSFPYYIFFVYSTLLACAFLLLFLISTIALILKRRRAKK